MQPLVYQLFYGFHTIGLLPNFLISNLVQSFDSENFPFRKLEVYGCLSVQVSQPYSTVIKAELVNYTGSSWF